MHLLHRWHLHYQDATSDKIYTVGVYADRDPPQPATYTVLVHWGRRLAKNHISQTKAQSLTHSQAFNVAVDLVTAKQRKGYNLIDQQDFPLPTAPPHTKAQSRHTLQPEPPLPFARKLRL